MKIILLSDHENYIMKINEARYNSGASTLLCTSASLVPYIPVSCRIFIVVTPYFTYVPLNAKPQPGHPYLTVWSSDYCIVP